MFVQNISKVKKTHLQHHAPSTTIAHRLCYQKSNHQFNLFGIIVSLMYDVSSINNSHIEKVIDFQSQMVSVN